MEEDLEKDLKNLMYTIEMHHISSEPIQNLIARYKELEEEIKINKIKIDFLVGKKLAEIDKHAKEVEIKMNALYIPKSKIKEKIEELEAMSISKDIYYDDIKRLLQELLED